MSYLVLARKYRPQTFSEVAGQDVLTKTLQGALQEDRVGHAYLFSGPRGTGKTTTARIFAKALNCAEGPTTNPCGTCERCQAIEAGSDVDVLEIDAASHTGVDNIRDLREQAAYAPMRARYKIYIIDEVHMLSKGAFNALLKTLEEPPPHVKFLFATTELDKVPDTILSRCQVLRLGLFQEEVIAERLQLIFERESVGAEEGVALELARLARGSMRDALSVTDQLLALVGSSPSVEDVRRMAGPTGPSGVEKVLEAIERGDRAEVLESLGPEGREGEWVAGLLRQLRGSLLVAHAAEESQLLADFAHERERLAARTQRLGTERIGFWMESIVAARERMTRVPDHARVLLELCLLELCRSEETLPLSELAGRLLELEGRLGGPRTDAPREAQVTVVPTPPPQAEAPRERSPAPTPSRDEPAAPAATEPPRGTEQEASRVQPAARLAVAEPPQPQPIPPEPSAPEPSPEPSAPERAGPKKARPVVGTAATWSAVLKQLRPGHAQLADLFESRGHPLAEGSGQVRIQLQRLRPEEQELVADPETRRICEAAFSEVTAGAVQVVLEDKTKRQPGGNDAFTREVADLFGGHIED